MVHLVRRLAAQGLVRAVLIVPIDDEPQFVLEIRLVLGHCDQKQNLLERAMEAFDNRNGAVLVNRSESRQDIPGFAPDVFEVFYRALELGALVDNQVFRANSLRRHDAIQGGCQFLRCGSAWEHRESHRPPREMIDHVQHPPTHGPPLPDCVGDPGGPEATGNGHRR